MRPLWDRYGVGVSCPRLKPWVMPTQPLCGYDGVCLDVAWCTSVAMRLRLCDYAVTLVWMNVGLQLC